MLQAKRATPPGAQASRSKARAVRDPYPGLGAKLASLVPIRRDAGQLAGQVIHQSRCRTKWAIYVNVNYGHRVVCFDSTAVSPPIRGASTERGVCRPERTNLHEKYDNPYIQSMTSPMGNSGATGFPFANR